MMDKKPPDISNMSRFTYQSNGSPEHFIQRALHHLQYVQLKSQGFLGTVSLK